MDELLLNFLGREREKTVRIGERTCAMRLLSARETLSLRREIAQLDCADEEERALRANAALLKRSLTEGEEAAFASAEDVENALSVGEINELVRCYALLDGAENPSSEDGREKVEALKKAWSICGAKLGETAGGGNASFDMARFIRMKEGRKP